MADIGIDTLLERIQTRLKALNLTERKASVMATGKPDAIRYIRTRQAMPSTARLLKLAAVLEASPAYLVGDSAETDWEKYAHTAKLIGTLSDTALDKVETITRANRGNRPDAIPMFAVTPEGHALFDSGLNDKRAVNLFSFSEVIADVFEKPLSLENKKCKAFRMPDSSMYPIFEAGALIVVETSVSINYRDDIILGVDTEGLEKKVCLIGRLSGKGDDYIELTQFSPSVSFRVPIDKVWVIHRVVKYAELISASAA